MSFRLLCRLGAIALFSVAVIAIAAPPDDGDDPQFAPGSAPGRMTKAEEQRKFHSPVKGMDDAARMRGYDQRLRMEAASPFGGLNWRTIGPMTQGGRVVTITAPALRPDQIYVAFATGGLYRTEDDGITWTSMFEREAAFGIGDIATSRDGKTIWIGSGEANAQRTSYAGAGMFKSTDEGKTWRRMGLEATQHIGKVLIDPKHEDTVWVAASGHLYSQNPERGIYKTIDGGRTWVASLQVDSDTGGIDLAIDPRNSDVVYASMWERDRRAWNFLESGKGSAVYKTINGGKTWTKLTGLPTGYAAGRIGLALCPSKPDSIYAFNDNQDGDERWLDRDDRAPSGVLTPRRFLLLNEDSFVTLDPKVVGNFLSRYAPSGLKPEEVIQAVKDKKMTLKDLRAKIEERNANTFGEAIAGVELYRSDDAGKTWHEADTGHFGELGGYGYYFGKVFVNPKDDQEVYVTSLDMIRSRDGGRSWTPVRGGVHSDQHALLFDQRGSGKLWIGCDGGVYITSDWKTTHHIENLPVGQATALALDNATPYNVYVGLQDNGTTFGPSSGGGGFRRGSSGGWQVIGGGDGAVVQVDPRDGTDTVYTSSQFGAVGAVNNIAKSNWRLRPAGGDNRFNWITPFILSSFNPEIVYLGSNKLYKSTNQGKAFEAISPDLTKNLPNGDVPYSTIKDISESILQAGLIYVGTDDGNVKMTPDGGTTWTDIATPAPTKWVTRVLASKWDKDTVYVSQSGYREDDFTAYLYRSTDRGKTWTSISSGLPPETINVVREDPKHKGVVYVGTDMGVFVSFDSGSNWTALTGDLPHLPVHDLLVQARDEELVVATHARGALILPLKMVYGVAEYMGKDLVLESVSDARRPTGYESLGQYGAESTMSPIKGQFWTKVAGPAVFQIKDKDSKVVREKKLAAITGYNFFDFDILVSPSQFGGPLKADPKNPLNDPYAARRAVYLPVGDYTVELTVGGKTVKQAWKITTRSFD